MSIKWWQWPLVASFAFVLLIVMVSADDIKRYLRMHQM
jgi:hypothetical protein